MELLYRALICLGGFAYVLLVAFLQELCATRSVTSLKMGLPNNVLKPKQGFEDKRKATY